MQLYNTLTRKTETIAPLDGNTYRIYSCGPTVYDTVHIGNLSAFITADTLRRVLAAQQSNVKHIMNLTDVDDKTINRSQQRYPNIEPKDALKRLTEEYTQQFFHDMLTVGNDTAAISFVRATDNIDQMQALIRELHRNGFAYIADDGVYFSIKAYTDSGKVYGQLSPVTASSTSTSRIQNDEYDKVSAQDFALWKMQKPHEPSWEFTIDGNDLSGRPGWHIECSAMSTDNLGQPFDIHTGGVDLIFPHHENEIAQSTAGKADSQYAHSFVHNEHILVDGKKMSKSLGNFYTLQDITAKGYDPLAFRLLILQAHYRSQAHFSFDNLEAAQNRLQHWRNIADMRWQVMHTSESATPQASDNAATSAVEHFNAALQADLDTPAALAAVDTLMDTIESEGMQPHLLPGFTELLKQINVQLGIDLSSDDISDQQKQLIAEREQARTAKDWIVADKFRDALKDAGIAVRDTPRGAVWYHIRPSQTA